MIHYSQSARPAIARLFRAYNDIDVYVEDSSYVGLYEKLINRSLSGKAKVSRVIPLGPRNVVEQAAMADTVAGGRPRLYIVDGDLDLIAKARQPSAPHLFRLNVYSLENVLLTSESIEKYCDFASPSAAQGACARQVKPSNLLDDMKSLVSYIVVLSIARRFDLRGGVFSINPPSVNKTINGRHIGPDSSKVMVRVRKIVEAIVAEVGWKQYRSAKTLVYKNLRRRNIGDHRLIPGKYFGMLYLNERVVAAGGMSLPQKVAASYLADWSNLQNDKRLERRLRKVAKNA